MCRYVERERVRGEERERVGGHAGEATKNNDFEAIMNWKMMVF